MVKLFASPVLRQYAVVIVANLSVISLGLSVVWASPMLIKLRDENQTVLSRPLSENEEAWVVSINQLVGLPVFLVSGTLMDFFGRKNMLLFIFVPRLVMCILAIFATEVWTLLLSRAVSGIAESLTIAVVSTYASEIAGKEIRGASGTATQIMSALGMMIMFAVGPFVPYLTVNIMMTCIVVVTFIPLYFIPESPYFLYAKGRKKDAEEILTFLRGTEELAHIEINEYSAMSNTKVDRWSLLKNKVVIKTFALVIFLSIGQQMIGYNAVNFYLQTIFETTQTSISSEVSSLIIGFIQLLACACTFVLTDRFGRKPILCISLMGMCIGMIGLATFFLLFDNGHEITGFLNYVPLISIILVIYGYNAGMGSLFWMLVAELFDGPVRPYGVSCAVFVSTFFGFLLSLLFPTMNSSIGAASTYSIFAASNLVVALVIFLFVPETKGKTFTMIQNELGRKVVMIRFKSK